MKVLITGGSGLVGTEISEALLDRGHEVVHLGRSARSGRVPAFEWSPSTGTFDARAFQGVDAVIHLAGASVSKPWTATYKQTIIESRLHSAQTLERALAENPQIRTVVCASASGFYPPDEERIWMESDKPEPTGFLSQTTAAWEQALKPLGEERRQVIFRIGLVMSAKGGALPEMARPVKWVGAASLGSGRQWMPWIHIADLVGLFVTALENDSMNGIYNAAAPNPARHKDFMKVLSKVMHRWFVPISVPAFLFRMLMGERAALVLDGQHLSTEKVQQLGYNFKYPQLSDALKDLLG